MHYCLFDIDGTLLNTGGAGQAAMEAALLEMFDIDRSAEGISYAGRTDYAIVTGIFAFFEIDVDHELHARFVDTYLAHLASTLAARDGLVLPGVVELLDLLRTREDVVLGLLTGNVQRGAEAKLSHYDLHGHFEFGGYGDRHADRVDVARVAYDEAREHFGAHLPTDRVWVIGDTPADVACGRAIDANVIGVATGVFDREEIAAAGPDHVFDDFADYERVADLVR